MDAKSELKRILENLAADAQGAREEARRFLQGISSEALVRLEGELRKEGVSTEAIHHLCADHRAAAAGTGNAFRRTLPDDHPIAVLMDEHQRILANLTALEGHVEPPTIDPAAKGGRARLEAVRELGEKLVGAEPHHQREEQVLFPELRERGVEGPPAVMESEHIELRRLKHAVRDGAAALLEGKDPAGWSPLRCDAHALIGMLRDHIAKEDDILYPMAVQVIEPQRWPVLREKCDAIGYCCGQHTAGGA